MFNFTQNAVNLENKFSMAQGDCLEVMKEIPDNIVDLVLCDLPYGEVSQKSSGLRLLDRGNADKCEIDLYDLVKDFNRVCSGSIYAFCGTKQISILVEQFQKYKMTTRVGVWEKSNPSPMNGTRLWVSGLEFCVFARKPKAIFNEHCQKALWKAPSGRSKVHPTEKPIKLMERLILASSNEGSTILDNTMGSGTTGVACMNTNRRFLGIEMDSAYFQIAQERISQSVKI